MVDAIFFGREARERLVRGRDEGRGIGAVSEVGDSGKVIGWGGGLVIAVASAFLRLRACTRLVGWRLRGMRCRIRRGSKKDFINLVFEAGLEGADSFFEVDAEFNKFLSDIFVRGFNRRAGIAKLEKDEEDEILKIGEEELVFGVEE